MEKVLCSLVGRLQWASIFGLQSGYNFGLFSNYLKQNQWTGLETAFLPKATPSKYSKYSSLRMQLCSHSLQILSFLITSLDPFLSFLFPFHTRLGTQSTKHSSYKATSTKLIRSTSDTQMVWNSSVSHPQDVKYPSIHKLCLSIWPENRALKIKDQKPLKWKHSREGRLKWWRIMALFRNSARELPDETLTMFSATR